MFAVNTNGTGYTVLYFFSTRSGSRETNSDGAFPKAGLVSLGNTLYGTASAGGTNGYGTVFSLSFPLPQLAIKYSGTNVNVMWPNALDGFYGGLTLQSATSFVPTATWSVVPTAPVIVNGQDTVTNAITGQQKFFRLQSQ